MACAAFAVAIAVSACCVMPAFATESTVKVAKTDDNRFIASKELVVANVMAPPVGVKPSVPTLSKVSEASEPLSLIEPAAGVEPAFVLPVTDEIYDLVFNIRRKYTIISDATIGLERGGLYYLPVYELARLFKFSSQIDVQNGRIEGEFFNSQNRYSIDTKAGTYTVLGETAKLPEGSYLFGESERAPNDIYVTTELLNKIWPLQLEFDFSELSVWIKTTKRLPYELALERRKKQLLLEKEDEPEFDLTHVPSGYKTLGPQIFNFNTNLRWDAEESEIVSGSAVTGRGDLLGASADYTLNWLTEGGGTPELRNARLKLTRKDYGDAGLLPFGLKLVEAGDVISRPSPFVSRAIAGRGLVVSTATNERQKVFDEVIIQGSGVPGWEVELYRGRFARELVDFGVVQENGEYRFDDVRLNYGRNEFKIILYGPQGEIEERTEEYNIKRDLLAVGETTFEASAIDTNEQLFDVRDLNSQNLDASYNVRVNRGINQNVTAYATATRTPVRGETRDYLTVGADLNVLGGAGQAEIYKQLDGGAALDLRFGRRIAGFNTTLQTTFLNDFESVEAGVGDSAKTFEGRFRTARSFELPFANLTLSSNGAHIVREDAPTVTNWNASQSITIEDASLNHTYINTWTDGDRTSTEGQLYLNARLTDALSLRTGFEYDTHPEAFIDFARFNLNYRGDNNFRAGVAVRQGVENTDDTNVDLSASYDFGTFTGGGQIDWSREDGMDFVLRANTTFGPEGEDYEYHPTTKYSGSVTAIAARLYEDLDFDGVFSEGDIPVEGASVRVNQRQSPKSDKNGFIDMPRAGQEGFARITLDKNSSPDPFFTADKDGYSVILRRGTKPFINFPLYQSGAIDGVVTGEDGRPLSNVIVELLDETGRLVKEATTLFDGFYVIEFVKPGTYTVRLAPLHQVNVPPKTVTVTSEDLFAYGVDLSPLEQASEVSTTDVSDVRDGGRVAQKLPAQVVEGTLLPAPTSFDSPFDTAVKAVRIGEHPYKVRLVLDLSAPTSYSITSEDDGKIINIDLPSTAWDASREWKLGKHPIFKECGVYALPDGKGTRLRLVSRDKARIFYNAQIPAENGLPDRMYVDFIHFK